MKLSRKVIGALQCLPFVHRIKFEEGVVGFSELEGYPGDVLETTFVSSQQSKRL